MLFRKRWRDAAAFRREVTIRTIPTECYQDASDDGIPIKNQQTILVWNLVFIVSLFEYCEILITHSLLKQFFFFFTAISGSSIRDESLYTTITQKQSFDSMTLSQYQTVKLPTHNSVKFQSNVMNSSHPMVSCTHIDNARNNEFGPIIKCTAHDTDAYQPEFVHDKFNEIRISFSCTNKIQMRNPSRLSQMFSGFFGWQQNSRNIGYYSPPMEHPIDKISIRLDTCGIESNNDHAGYSLAVNPSNSNHNKSKNHVEFATNPIHISDGNDDGFVGGNNDGDAHCISNNSPDDCNATAPDDELSTYMEELRLRELR